MTLIQLRYLVAIADSGLNITLAAERVHATQPGLSRQLKQFEDELGFQLFTRKGKSLSGVTTVGAQVIERARNILAEAANIRALAANLRHEAAGELRVATTHTQARHVLPPAIARISKRFPQVSVHLMPSGDAEVLALLEKGEVDLALVSSAGGVPSGGLAVPLYRWSRVILVPKAHALAKGKRVPTLAELAKHPLVSYESSLRPDSSLRVPFSNAGLTPHIAITARDADLIKTYVRAGLGVGVLAEMALTSEDAADLVALDAGDLFPVCTTWLVLHRERVLRDYTLDLIVDLAPQLDARDLRRALAGEVPDAWPEPPPWSTLAGAGVGRSGRAAASAAL